MVYHWEERNKESPPVFELTARQRLTVKNRNKNVGQFLAAEVKKNPGQNESQQIFALCDRMVKERGQMIDQNPKVEVAPFFVSENRNKEYQFWGQQLGWQDVWTLWSKLLVKKWRRALGQDDRRIQAELYKIPLARKRENTLRGNPSKS